MKKASLIVTFIIFISCANSNVDHEDTTQHFSDVNELVSNIPKNNLWVFVLAGQSNMAGRAEVESQDTLLNERILSINADNQFVFAKEPLHYYEPNRAGLGNGLSFGRTIIKQIPDSISILILPAAVGGSSISQWLDDSNHRGVGLLSNFQNKVEIGKKHGILKAILWHQGESDSNEKSILLYQIRLKKLFKEFRSMSGNNKLPILVGELGSFSENGHKWNLINRAIRDYSSKDSYTEVISTTDLGDKGDKVHFDSDGQRILGQRFANTYLEKFKDNQYKVK